MLHELNVELPVSYYWDIDIENKKITESQKTFFKIRTQEIFGDCSNPLSNDKDYIGISYVDFDDYEIFKMLNTIRNDKDTIIRVNKLDNKRQKVFTIEYRGCKILNVKNNIKYNGDKLPLSDNVVYFDYKKRKVITQYY